MCRNRNIATRGHRQTLAAATGTEVKNPHPIGYRQRLNGRL